MKFTKRELDIIFCALEDCANSDDFREISDETWRLLSKVEKISNTLTDSTQ